MAGAPPAPASCLDQLTDVLSSSALDTASGRPLMKKPDVLPAAVCTAYSSAWCTAPPAAGRPDTANCTRCDQPALPALSPNMCVMTEEGMRSPFLFTVTLVSGFCCTVILPLAVSTPAATLPARLLLRAGAFLPALGADMSSCSDVRDGAGEPALAATEDARLFARALGAAAAAASGGLASRANSRLPPVVPPTRSRHQPRNSLPSASFLKAAGRATLMAPAGADSVIALESGAATARPFTSSSRSTCTLISEPKRAEN
mmetsp:Transcript_2320/g.5860  ORF Transcript_2320/g.5860 Transcript_2320/m.5860 type:complete len:259 (+) Transcript_2320:647-1423(+)